MTTATKPRAAKDTARSRATQPKLPAYDKATADAAALEVIEELAGIADPRHRLIVAARINNDAKAEADATRPRLYRLIFSLWAYDQVRALEKATGLGAVRIYNIRTGDKWGIGQEVPKVEGTLNTTDWTKVRALAKKKKRPRVPTAEALRDLPGLAVKYGAAVAREKAAREVRDEIGLALVREGRMTQAELAAIMDRNPSRVNHMLERTGAGRGEES